MSMKVIKEYRNPTGCIYALSLTENPSFPVECVIAQDVKDGKLVPSEDKIVLIISSQFGCPMKCKYCAVQLLSFRGNISPMGMYEQIEHLITTDGPEECAKAKLHFARMGEPTINFQSVLEVAREVIGLYPAYNFIPCLTTMAPASAVTVAALDGFLELGQKYYNNQVQLQFSINSTSEIQRSRMFDLPHDMFWSLIKIASYCNSRKKYTAAGRKVTLNFIGAEGYELDPYILKLLLDPKQYVIKITPVNTSEASILNDITSLLSYESPDSYDVVKEELESYGFEVILSVTTETEDITNMGCGQLASKVEDYGEVADRGS